MLQHEWTWELFLKWSKPVTKRHAALLHYKGTLSHQLHGVEEQLLGVGGGKSSSVQFSHSACLTIFHPHALQHSRPPCPSPTPGACSNSCPLCRCCHPTISSLSPSPPAFNLSQHQGLFQWVGSSQSGGPSIGASASASVLPVNIQDWLPLGLIGWILQSHEL